MRRPPKSPRLSRGVPRRFRRRVMARVKDKRVQESADRIAGWLVEHRAEFEQDGIDENSLASQIGISEADVTKAVDYLENHEDVVRWPRFKLKPGRGWKE